MKDTLIRRLRASAEDFSADGVVWPGDLLAAAADEIDRLINVIDSYADHYEGCDKAMPDTMTRGLWRKK